MELPIQKKLGIAFWVLALVDIAGISLDLPVLHYTAKPLLMPALLLLMHYSPTAPGKGLLMTGLVFAWLGDVLLMFESRHALFFIFGLVSFLTTHVFYILYFLLIRSAAP
ncbi:MAG TPA: lysoplasmalogenase family protein, partial [Ferruginibacter sp.]|nr:lysoplasmalogenase family protein [Ferruginibacter sp.]